jgi:hypothetical protein
MRFKAVRFCCRLFNPAEYYVDLMPVVKGVRLHTIDGRYIVEKGVEKRWEALWDPGAMLTVIPRRFLSALGLAAVAYTNDSLRDFAGAAQRQPWYPVHVGLPGLPFIGVRAIVPDDVVPEKPRTRITIGRDILMRLCSASVTNMPYNKQAGTSGALGDSSDWNWYYRRAFPKGWIDALRRCHDWGAPGP